MSQKIRLTQTVQKGGCAAKVAASELRQILKKVQFPPMDSAVLVDGGLFDDAAIYRVSPDIALVQTLDFFTPIVDSPRTFGAVAAANALSDVYAMGGLPKTAMAILAFPIATMEQEVIVEVLQGASDIMKQAKVNFVGGHSIDDDSLKFGLSVTGFVHPEKVWSNAGAQVGDALILTKKIGTGSISAALKRSVVAESEIQEVLDSMMQINRVPEILGDDLRSAIHAATDITGFGLLGHALQMAQASQVSMELDMDRVPYFAQAPGFLEQGFLTKAHRTNLSYVDGHTLFEKASGIQKLLAVDPQTSGGLLLSVTASRASELLTELQKYFPAAQLVGRVRARDSVALFL